MEVYSKIDGQLGVSEVKETVYTVSYKDLLDQKKKLENEITNLQTDLASVESRITEADKLGIKK